MSVESSLSADTRGRAIPSTHLFLVSRISSDTAEFVLSAYEESQADACLGLAVQYIQCKSCLVGFERSVHQFISML